MKMQSSAGHPSVFGDEFPHHADQHRTSDSGYQFGGKDDAVFMGRANQEKSAEL
jgi:hypothetical protein